MCIIVVKPRGVEYPTWDRLRTCFTRNPDGAGIMYSDGKRVHYSKGFMTFESFKKEVKHVKKVAGDAPVVMHFRIKTSGEVSRECCHPFPLSPSLEEIRKTEGVCDVGIAHNGVLYNRATTKLMSDTMDFVMSILYPISRLNGNWLNNKHATKLITDELDGDRLCVLTGEGKIHRYGHWIEDDGCYFSNEHYKPMYMYPRTYDRSWNSYYYGLTQTDMKACPVCNCCDWCDENGSLCLTRDDVWGMISTQQGLDYGMKDVFFKELEKKGN